MNPIPINTIDQAPAGPGKWFCGQMVAVRRHGAVMPARIAELMEVDTLHETVATLDSPDGTLYYSTDDLTDLCVVPAQPGQVWTRTTAGGQHLAAHVLDSDGLHSRCQLFSDGIACEIDVYVLVPPWELAGVAAPSMGGRN